jgi:hypothetical protein
MGYGWMGWDGWMVRVARRTRGSELLLGYERKMRSGGEEGEEEEERKQ